MSKVGRNLLAAVWVVLAGVTLWMFTLEEETAGPIAPESTVIRAPGRKPKPPPVNLSPPSRDNTFIICWPRPKNYSGIPPVPPRPDMNKAVTLLPIAEATRELHNPETHPMDDLDILQTLLETYRRAFKENPVAGLNEEVVEALLGVNLKRIGLIPPDHPAINEKGQLIDRWGTPYFLHPMSAKQMEIKSAGPDRKWSTADDLTLK